MSCGWWCVYDGEGLACVYVVNFVCVNDEVSIFGKLLHAKRKSKRKHKSNTIHKCDEMLCR